MFGQPFRRERSLSYLAAYALAGFMAEVHPQLERQPGSGHGEGPRHQAVLGNRIIHGGELPETKSGFKPARDSHSSLRRSC